MRAAETARRFSHWAALRPEFAACLRELLIFDGFCPHAIESALISPIAYGGAVRNMPGQVFKASLPILTVRGTTL